MAPEVCDGARADAPVVAAMNAIRATFLALGDRRMTRELARRGESRNHKCVRSVSKQLVVPPSRLKSLRNSEQGG
jgi:hypothetical protein